jgi:hypothetical protein
VTPLTRRERLKGDLREIVLSGCSGFGLLIALPWALDYQGRPRPCQPGQSCVAEGLRAAMVPVLARSAVGLLIGLLVGLLLCLTVPGLKRVRSR